MFCWLLWEYVTGESLSSYKTTHFEFSHLIHNLLLCSIDSARHKLYSQSLRRCGYNINSAKQTLELWQGIFKEIGGKFGTSVLSYFVFLKWLLMFNIFSFLVNFGFITIPVLVYDHSPNIPPNVNFKGLEILTGAVSGSSNQTFLELKESNLQIIITGPHSASQFYEAF